MPVLASFFLICAGDSVGAGYCLRVILKPGMNNNSKLVCAFQLLLNLFTILNQSFLVLVPEL